MDVDMDMGAIFASLPEEKQRSVAEKFVDQQINNKEFGTIVMMPEKDEDGEYDFSKPMKASAVDFAAMVKELGKDYAVNMMMEMLSSGAVSCKAVSGESIKALLEKCAAGKATPEEYAMANAIIKKISNGFSRTDVTTFVSHMLLDFIDYCNVKHNVEPYMSDVMTSLIMLVIGSMINQPGTPMARFRNSGPEVSMGAISKISNDIDKALDESIFKDGKPSNQFMVLALFHLATVYAAKNEDEDKMIFASAEVLAKMFGVQEEYGPNGKNSEDDDENSEDSD